MHKTKPCPPGAYILEGSTDIELEYFSRFKRVPHKRNAQNVVEMQRSSI